MVRQRGKLRRVSGRGDPNGVKQGLGLDRKRYISRKKRSRKRKESRIIKTDRKKEFKVKI